MMMKLSVILIEFEHHKLIVMLILFNDGEITKIIFLFYLELLKSI
jgi:hypothetical protein